MNVNKCFVMNNLKQHYIILSKACFQKLSCLSFDSIFRSVDLFFFKVFFKQEDKEPNLKVFR